MSNTTNRNIRAEEMFMPYNTVLRYKMSKEASKATQERMSSLNCRKDVKEEEQEEEVGERKKDETTQRNEEGNE